MRRERIAKHELGALVALRTKLHQTDGPSGDARDRRHVSRTPTIMPHAPTLGVDLRGCGKIGTGTEVVLGDLPPPTDLPQISTHAIS